jgi:hypothetical protein
MNQNGIEDPHTSSTNEFLAILNSTRKKQIIIDESEYLILKEIRRMRIEQKHCQKMIGYRDGKLLMYTVNLETTFDVRTHATLPIAPIDKTGL